MTKVLCGDPSDTIEGIVSKKVAKELIEHDAPNNQFIEKYMIEHGLKEKYDLNMRLIDMSNIPQDLKEKVLHSMRYKNEHIQFIWSTCLFKFNPIISVNIVGIVFPSCFHWSLLFPYLLLYIWWPPLSLKTKCSVDSFWML